MGVCPDFRAQVEPARDAMNIAALQRFEMTSRNPGRGGDLLNRETARPAGSPQSLTQRLGFLFAHVTSLCIRLRGDT